MGKGVGYRHLTVANFLCLLQLSFLNHSWDLLSLPSTAFSLMPLNNCIIRAGKPPSDYCQQVHFLMFMFSYFCSAKEDTDFVFINRLVNGDLSRAKIATDFILWVSPGMKPGFFRGFLDVVLCFNYLCVEVGVVLMFLERPTHTYLKGEWMHFCTYRHIKDLYGVIFRAWRICKGGSFNHSENGLCVSEHIHIYTLYLCNIFFLFMYNLLLCIDGISAGGLESQSTLLILSTNTRWNVFWKETQWINNGCICTLGYKFVSVYPHCGILHTKLGSIFWDWVQEMCEVFPLYEQITFHMHIAASSDSIKVGL